MFFMMPEVSVIGAGAPGKTRAPLTSSLADSTMEICETYMRTVDLMVAVREVRISCCFNVITVMLDIWTHTVTSIPKILKALFC